MLKIRLKRAGSKKRPFYRVVVTDSRTARDSRSVEDIGYYNPLEDPIVVNVDRDKVTHWTDRGAEMTDTVRTILRHDNSVHPTRRQVAEFAPAEPEAETRKPKKGKAAAKAEEAAGGVAVAEAPAPAAEAPAAEAPAAEEEPKAEA